MTIQVKDYYLLVAEFNSKIPHNDQTKKALRIRLILEELKEVEAELAADKQINSKIAKELCDLVYVVLGTFYDEYYGKMQPLIHTADKTTLGTTSLISLIYDSVLDYELYNQYKSIAKMSYYTFSLVDKLMSMDNFKKCFAEVHRANILKLENMELDENGKVKKVKATKKSRANLDFLD